MVYTAVSRPHAKYTATLSLLVGWEESRVSVAVRVLVLKKYNKYTEDSDEFDAAHDHTYLRGSQPGIITTLDIYTDNQMAHIFRTVCMFTKKYLRDVIMVTSHHKGSME